MVFRPSKESSSILSKTIDIKLKAIFMDGHASNKLAMRL